MTGTLVSGLGGNGLFIDDWMSVFDIRKEARSIICHSPSTAIIKNQGKRERQKKEIHNHLPWSSSHIPGHTSTT